MKDMKYPKYHYHTQFQTQANLAMSVRV